MGWLSLTPAAFFVTRLTRQVEQQKGLVIEPTNNKLLCCAPQEVGTISGQDNDMYYTSRPPHRTALPQDEVQEAHGSGRIHP